MQLQLILYIIKLTLLISFKNIKGFSIKVKDILEQSSGDTILFLGKFTRISQDELKKFVEKKGFNFATKYSEENLALVVLSSLINPYEEELSNELYEKGIKDISLDEFEAYYISTLKANSLLMSLKLSNNQDRLISFLKSSAIDDELFLKLIQLYNWDNEGLFDSDINRDITLAFINRFFVKRLHFNHTDIAHSPATLLDIAMNSTNTQALKALFKMPEHHVNIKEYNEIKPKNIKESLALNISLDSELKKLLLNLNSDRVDALLALNPAINKNEQLFIYSRAKHLTKLNLSKNPSIDNEVFQKLLNENSEVIESLLLNQKITQERFNLIEKSFYKILAKSQHIQSIKKSLIDIDKEIDFILATNPLLNKAELLKLYDKYGSAIVLNLSQNPNTPSFLLEEFYKLNNIEITKAIASNPNTPQEIINELYNKNSYELNKALAKNPNLNDEYIEFFKLDNELLNIMSQVKELREKIAKKREYL